MGNVCLKHKLIHFPFPLLPLPCFCFTFEKERYSAYVALRCARCAIPKRMPLRNSGSSSHIKEQCLAIYYLNTPCLSYQNIVIKIHRSSPHLSIFIWLFRQCKFFYIYTMSLAMWTFFKKALLRPVN